MWKALSASKQDAIQREAHDRSVNAMIECIDTIKKFVPLKDDSLTYTVITPAMQGMAEGETLLKLTFDPADEAAPESSLVLAVQKNGTIWPCDAEGKALGRALSDEKALFTALGDIAEWSGRILGDQPEQLAQALNEFETKWNERGYKSAPAKNAPKP
jgi:hypothetical protein